MSEYRKLNISYNLGRQLGAGAFGEVYLAQEDGGKERTFAIKFIKCTKNEELQNALREIGALARLDHEHILKMIDFGLRQRRKHEAEFLLALEYCSRGTLQGLLGTRNPRSCKLRWMRSITSAVAYLHSNGVTHQDLKPHNILLSTDGVLKVADFGLARRFAQRDEGQSWQNYYIQQGVGALAYVAPEMLGEKHTYKVDIFSLGIIFHAILERKFKIYRGENCYGVFVQAAGERMEPIGSRMHEEERNLPVPFPGRRRRLIERMLKYNPRERPTAEEVMVVLRSRWRRLIQLAC